MDDWQRLADAVQSRRAHLGHTTRQQFAEATGFPQKTLGDLERLRRNNFDQSTISRLERALKWSQGTARVILAGGPVPDQFAPALAYSIDTATGMKITPSGKEFPPVVDDILHLLTDDFSPLDADERRHLEEHLRHLVLMTMSMARRVRAAGGVDVGVVNTDGTRMVVQAKTSARPVDVPDQHPAPVSARRP